jgi:hypothetical protein
MEARLNAQVLAQQRCVRWPDWRPTEDHTEADWRTLADISVLISQACLSRHLSEMMDLEFLHFWSCELVGARHFAVLVKLC